MSVRPCGDDCWTADQPHLEPVVEWIGDVPISHGERDVPYGHPEQEFCLCGHPNYLTCPGEGIMTMVIGDPYGGLI